MPGAGRESQNRASQPFWLLPAGAGGVLGWEGLLPRFLGSLESAVHHPTEETLVFPSLPLERAWLARMRLGRGGEGGPQTYPEVSTDSRPLDRYWSIIFLESALAEKLRLQIFV